MAECRAGEFPDQIIIEDDQTCQSEYQGFVKSLNGTESTAHKSSTGVSETYEYGEPIRDLKGGGGCAGGNGACTLHAESGSCPFPALPRPLNFPSGSTSRCRCRCQCPCPPVECPPVKCPPRPVESGLPGLHQQYRDFYPDCKEIHLPVGFRNCVENDDPYLPYSRPMSSNSCCNMPMSSESCSPPPPPPTQRCQCCQCPRILEPNPFPQTCFQEVDPCCSPKRLVCPAKVDRGFSPPPPKCLSFPNEVKSRSFPAPPKYPPSPDQVEPCRPSPSLRCLPSEINSCCFPSPPKCPPWQARVNSSRSPPSPKRITLPSLPVSPKRPTSPSCQVDSYPPPPPKRVAVPTRADPCCFPISPRQAKSPSSTPSSNRLDLAKVDPLSFPKRVIRLALAAQVNPCCHPPSPKRFALPAPVSEGMDAEHNIMPKPDVSEKSCVESDQKPGSKNLWSQKPVQQIYVCLPYPANPLQTSPNNCLSSLLIPTPCGDEKDPPNFTIRSGLNKIPIRSPPPPPLSKCQECISQMPTPRSPNCNESLDIGNKPMSKSLLSRSISPMKPNIKSNLITSSCQYSPRIDTERPIVLMSQKSGPSPPTSPCHLDLTLNSSPFRPPRPTMYHPQKHNIEFPNPPHTKSPSSHPLTQPPPAAELVPVEKHVICNCGPRVVSILHKCAHLDQSCSERSVSPSRYEAISRVLRPDSPRRIFPEIPARRHMECTCQKHDKRKNQFGNASQLGSRSQSPSHSSKSTAQYRETENTDISKFLNDVKRVLKKDFPSRMRQADQKQDLERDFYLSVRSALKSELPVTDLSSSIRTDQKQELSSADFSSIVRSTLKPEFPSSSGGRTTNRKQDQKQDHEQEFSPETYCKGEFLSSLRPKELKQENASCVTTTERGTSPIMTNSNTNGLEIDNPKTAPGNVTSMNNETPNKPKPLQSGHDHIDATKKPSTRTPQQDNPTEDCNRNCRFDPEEAANSQHPSKRNVNKRVTSSWMPRGAPNRCCCGMCKSTYSRSHLTTKCLYCVNEHSWCCGMCSCPFPQCTSKSPIPASADSMSTTSAGFGKLPLCNSNHPGDSRPKSLSPLERRSYVAGPREITDKHGTRSKSPRPKCKARQKERQPSPRALLKSFNSYLNSQCRRSKTGSAPHRRCSHGNQRSQHWHSPPETPEQNCSQRSKRSMMCQTQRGLQKAALRGTHPFLMSSRPSRSRFSMDPIPQPRLLSGSHRGCCCPRCANGKL